MGRLNIKEIMDRVEQDLICKRNLSIQEEYHMKIVSLVDELFDWMSTQLELFEFEQLIDAIKNHAISRKAEELCEKNHITKTVDDK